MIPWNNHWWNIHDFSPVEGGSNWARLGQMFKVSNLKSAKNSTTIKYKKNTQGEERHVEWHIFEFRTQVKRAIFL